MRIKSGASPEKNYHFVDSKRLWIDSKCINLMEMSKRHTQAHAQTYLFYFKLIGIHFEFLRIDFNWNGSESISKVLKAGKKRCDFFSIPFIQSSCMHFNGKWAKCFKLLATWFTPDSGCNLSLPKPISKVFLFNAFFPAQWAVQKAFYMQI